MVIRFRSWWQKANKTSLVIAFSIGIVIVIGIVLGYWFQWTWTGFPAKNLWDWLQLLFVPLILTIGGYWLNRLQQAREQRMGEQQRALEHEIALSNQRETALQVYLTDMSELLIEKHLRDSDPGAEVRKIARVKTLTVLSHLDKMRKRSVLQFLYEADLIRQDHRILDLKGADLSGVNLSMQQRSVEITPTQGKAASGIKTFHIHYRHRFNLSEADLSETDLSEADLFGVDLSGANLSGADLRRANLTAVTLSSPINRTRPAKLTETILEETVLRYADLSGTDLRDAWLNKNDLTGANLKGAQITDKQLEDAKTLHDMIMPDGSIHP